MRSFFQKKLWIVLLATLGLGALTVLALSLDQVPFHEAQHYASPESVNLPPVTAQDVTDAWGNVPFWKLVILWGLILLLVLLVALLISPELRKRLLKMLIRAVATVIAIFLLLRLYGGQLLNLQQAANATKSAASANLQQMPTFQPPHISPTFSYIVSFAVALISIAIFWVVYRGWQRYMRLNTKKSLDELAHIARSSLRDLNDGRDSSDVIINCYLRMNDVVADKRKLQREIAMTPQEFAVRLERAGLPGDAVRRLTRLFETVRYGDRKSAPKDVNEAVLCLNTILHYCGEAI